MIIPEKAIVAVDNLTNEVRKMREDGGMPLKHEFDQVTTAQMSVGIFVSVFLSVTLALIIYAKYQYNLNQNTND